MSSGKSTLMKVMAGLMECDSGDRAVTKNCRIGYLPQSGIVHKGCTLLEEVDRAFHYGYELHAQMEQIGATLATMSKDVNSMPLLERQAEIIAWLEESGWNRREVLARQTLEGLGFSKDDMTRSVEEFSGGWQMRIALAKALLEKPDILLLDEPAAGMNPKETAELTEFIRQIRDEYNLTIFMIEHHMDLVMEISDRIYVLDFGKRIAAGTPEEIQNNPRVIEAYLGGAADE